MAELTEYKGKALVALDENEPLFAGDRVLIRFKWLIDGAWLRAYQWAAIEKKLEGRSDWRVVSYRNEGDFLDAEIEVLASPKPKAVDPGSGITQASLIGVGFGLTALAIGMMVTSVVYALSISEYRRMVAAGEIPAEISAVGQVGKGLHVLAYVAGGVVGLLILRTLLGRRS